MELRHLRYFISVAEALHFSRAAKKLHVAQSALSRQIRDLEEEVGTLLLERTNRSVALTHAGQVFLEEARRTIASANRAKMRAEQAARGEVGRLTIGYVLSATGAILTEAIRSFQRTHPQVELVLHDLSEVEQNRQLLGGTIDLAFTRTKNENTQCAQRLIERGRLIAIIPAEHPLASRAEIPIQSLAPESFILGRDEDFPAFNEFQRAVCRRAGFEMRVRQNVRDLAGILWMVSAGLGVGFTSCGLGELMRTGLASRPISPRVPMSLWGHWRKADKSPLLKDFLDSLPDASRKRPV